VSLRLNAKNVEEIGADGLSEHASSRLVALSCHARDQPSRCGQAVEAAGEKA